MSDVKRWNISLNKYGEPGLAKLHAGQEPVAAQVRFRRPEKGLVDWSVWQQTTIKPNMPAWSIDSVGYEVEYRLLYATPQPSAVPAGWKLVPVEPTLEMVSAAEEAHMPFGDMDIALRMAILSAPSAPATVPSVNQQLLEALEFAARSLATMTSADGSGHADIALCVLRMAGYAADERERIVGMWKHDRQWPTDAIAAARQEGGE